MRRSKLTADEIFDAEKAADDRTQTRKSGFAMAVNRDKGWQLLTNGATILWPLNKELRDGEARQYIPEGYFALRTPKGEFLLFDADEFRKWLRWVG